MYSLMAAGKKTVLELQRAYLKSKRAVFGGDKGAKGNSEKLQEVLQEWLGKDVALDEKRLPDRPKYNTACIVYNPKLV